MRVAQPDTVDVRTSWFQVDNVFFEARGTAWALVHFFRAAEFDFAHVLADKNAEVSVRQIIRELEASLEPLRSPMILNGGGYGLFANHSLVMANYLARGQCGGHKLERSSRPGLTAALSDNHITMIFGI